MLNHIIIHGRLVRDPEVRTTQAGKKVATFTVAVERDGKNQDGSRSSDFIDCVAWEARADVISRFFAKGREIIITGGMHSRDWTDKNGNKRRNWEILVDRVDFCGSRGDAQQGGAPAAQTSGYEVLEDEDDDLPF